MRKIDTALDLSWLCGELAALYLSIGRPMIRILIVGYVFAIRSERLLCRGVQVNLAYRGSASSASRMLSQIIRPSRGLAMSDSAREIPFVACSNVSSRHALWPVWLVAKAFAVDASLIQADANKQRSIAGQ